MIGGPVAEPDALAKRRGVAHGSSHVGLHFRAVRLEVSLAGLVPSRHIHRATSEGEAPLCERLQCDDHIPHHADVADQDTRCAHQ